MSIRILATTVAQSGLRIDQRIDRAGYEPSSALESDEESQYCLYSMSPKRYQGNEALGRNLRNEIDKTDEAL